MICPASAGSRVKRASLSVIYDLWRRATHIYIYSKQTLSDQTAYFFRRLRENIRLSAEKLNADFLFERREFCERLPAYVCSDRRYLLR